jgi:hypothetical protein
MVKTLPRFAVSFSIYVVLVATMSGLMPREQPRTIWGILVPLLFLILFLGFGAVFVASFSRLPRLPSRPIFRFTVPIVTAAVVLIVASFIGISLGAFLRDYVR